MGADVLFMTFGSAFITNNLGISLEDLPLVYGATGLTILVFSPLLGYLADRFGTLRVFIGGTLLAILVVGIYCHLETTPLWLVVLFHILLFIGVSARMVSSTALGTAVPKEQDRGSFMAIDAAVQQLAAGLAAVAAGWIVYQSGKGLMLNYPLLGWVVIGLMFITAGLMYRISRTVRKKNTE